MKKTIKNIVVFASGSGSNAIKIYEYFQKSQNVNIQALCCNKKSAPVIKKFQNIGIKTIIFEKKTFFPKQKIDIDLVFFNVIEG